MKKKISQKAEVEYQQHQFNRRPTQKGLIHSKSFVLAYIVLYGICTSEAALGKPSCEKSAVFLNNVQKAFAPPFVWTSGGEFFWRNFNKRA